MAYELIAFDMDGTLLDSRKQVAASSREAIDRALDAGKHVAFCSGRCPKMITEYRDALPRIRYAICCAGAVIYDVLSDAILKETDIDPEFVARSIAVADAQGAYILEVTSGRGVFMQEDEIAMAPECHVGIYEPLYRATSEFVEDARALAPTVGVSKLNFHFRDVAARDRAFEILQADGRAFITRCETSSLEFTAPGVDKGTGLAALCEQLGLDLTQAIAVGDADNDLAMLRAAGLGVAMGNANANARAAADVQVADNDHGGVAEAVDRFLLAG